MFKGKVMEPALIGRLAQGASSKADFNNKVRISLKEYVNQITG